MIFTVIILTVFVFVLLLSEVKTFDVQTLVFGWSMIAPMLFLLLLFLRKWVKTKWLVAPVKLSPLFLLICLVGPGTLAYLHGKYFSHGRISKAKIENISGIKDIPDYSIKEYNTQSAGFNRDYTNEYVMEFDEIPDKDFYSQLDTLKGWEKHGVKYTCDKIWGNNIDAPVPEGERSSSNGFFRMEITKGQREFTVSCGQW